jgi:hypothetical protein
VARVRHGVLRHAWGSLMAQLALGLAGAALGSFFGPVGAQVGFALGSAIGSTLGPGTTVEGPRQSDLKVQVSSYGASIPRGFGGFPVAGNVIWSTDLQEDRESEDVGKGGPSQTQVTYSYSVSCAIALCDGPIAGVRRIWADSKLVYDARDDADQDTIDASGEFAEFFTLYLGTEDQLPDPTIEAVEGAGNVPGYRGTAYIVFADLPLGDYGNRIPNFLFEVFTEGAPDAVQGDGLLNHFDALNGDGEVISALGPNITLTNGATIDAAASRFGAAGGTRTGTGFAEHKTEGITGRAGGRSWRLEWWQKATVTTNFGNILIFDNPDTGASIELGGTIFAAFTWDIQSSSINGGGAIGNVEPTLDMWQHVSIQYRHDIQQFAIFLHGQRIGNFSTSGDPYPVDPWGTNTFTRFRWIGTQVGVLIDEVYYHFEPETLYDDAYTVPTGPFDDSGGGETFTPGQVFLPDVVEALCLEAGLEASEIDVTDLPNTEVLGYVRTKQMSTRSAIEPLRQAFYFDAVESEGKVKFVARGGSSLVTIPEDDLGAVEGESDPQPATEPVRAQEAELPAVVNVVYLDRDRDYENGTQTARRVVTGSVQQTAIELPIVLTNQHGSDAAAVNLYDTWTARTEISWSTTKKYAKYEPTDIVTLVDGAISRQVRITDKSEEGPVIKWRGRDDKPAIYDPNTTPGEPTGTGATIRITGDTVVELIDSPIFLDANDDPGFYLAARGTRDGWTGGALYQSTDSGTSYSSLKTVTKTATMGTAGTELGNWTGGYVVDEVNTVTVNLDSGTLSTITRDSLLDSGQAAIIGNEVVGFQRAELIGQDQYRLSGLLRGLRGTEDQISEHAVGDRFILISSANWYRVDQLLSSVGNEYIYKPVTFGKSIEAATAESFTNTARGLKPLSPVDARAERASTGSITISWKRRTRLSSRLFGSVPLGEASEAYEVDVFEDGTFTEPAVANLSTAETSVVYSAAEQELGFGSIQDTLYVKIYQISESVGRGLPLTATLGANSGVESFTPDTLNPDPKVLLSAGDEWLAARDGSGNSSLGFYTYATDLNYASKITQSTTNPYTSGSHLWASDATSKKFVLLMRGSSNVEAARKLFYGTLPGGPTAVVPSFMPTNPPVGLWWTGSEFRALLVDGTVWSSATGASWTSQGATSGLPALSSDLIGAYIVKVGSALSMKYGDAVYYCSSTAGLSWSAGTGDVATLPTATYSDFFALTGIASNGSRAVLIAVGKKPSDASKWGLVYTSTDGQSWTEVVEQVVVDQPAYYAHSSTGNDGITTLGTTFLCDLWPVVAGSNANSVLQVHDFGGGVTLKFASKAVLGVGGTTLVLAPGNGTTAFDPETVYRTSNLTTYTPLDWDDE